jgi:hypothetical protein
MAAKKTKKKKVFRAATAVKAAARNVIGSPRATLRQTPKTKKSADKHKQTLSELLGSDE